MINQDYQYAYLIGDLIFGVGWLLLFFRRKDIRHKMILMSLVIGLIGPSLEFFYIKDYWRPQLTGNLLVGFEDVLFAFFIGGISSVLYEEILRKKETASRIKKHKLDIILFPLVAIFLMIMGSNILKINSIYSSQIALIFLGMYIIIIRRDLVYPALISGIFFSSFMFLFYLIFLQIFPGIIQAWWLLSNISGILIVGIPLEELIWGFSVGFLGGIVYEFILGMKFVKMKIGKY